MQTQEWMNRSRPRVLGILGAGACVLAAVLAFTRGNVPAELTMLALGAAIYTLGALVGTGRGWPLWMAAVALLAGLGWWFVNPAIGVLAVLAAIAVSIPARSVLQRRRGGARYLAKLAAVIKKETRDDRDPGEVLVPLSSPWRRAEYLRRGAAVGLPVRWVLPAHVPMDATARLIFAGAIAEVCKVPVSMTARRDHIDATPGPAEEKPAEDPEREEVARMNAAIRPAMGAELSIESTERDDDEKLTAITLVWPASYTSKALSIAVRNRVGRALSGVVGGAWKSAGWSTEDRRATYRRMPELPRKIAHPGRDASHPERVQFATLRNGGTAYMSLGDENPHCLIAGTTARGKTSLIRALLVGLPEAAQATLVDPKRASMLGLDQLPMVEKLLTRPETMSEGIRAFRAEMLDRYERLEDREVTVKQLQREPRVLVVDEAEMLFDMLDEWWKTEEKERVKQESLARAKLKEKLIKEQNQKDGETDVDKLPPLPSASGTRHPAISWFKNILQAGRQAGMYVIMASQQNDASWLGTSARNQFGTRISLGNLDQVGSRQVFGTMGATSGLDDYQGRAWVGMGSGAIFPEQAQTWWVPELSEDASDEDRAILDDLGLTIPGDSPSAPRAHRVPERPAPARDDLPAVPLVYLAPEEGVEEASAAPQQPEPTSIPSAYLSGDLPESIASPIPNPDHAEKKASVQVKSDPRGQAESADPAAPGDQEADHEDEEDDLEAPSDLETVDALDIEEGDNMWLDLGKGTLEPVAVVSVEVDAHHPELLEIGYTGEYGDGVVSMNDDDPVQREPR